MECTVLREEMLDVLYGEADAPAIRRVEEHVAVCSACRDELAAFRQLRKDLARWEAPAFARPAAHPWRGSVWARLAAAAGLLLALGAGARLAGGELRYEQGHLSFRIGPGSAELQRLVAEQEQRHEQDIRALTASLASRGGHDDEALLQKVRELIRESEARQAVVINAGLADFGERTEAQRNYDLARVSAGLSYLDGKTGEQVARTTELMGYVLQASRKK